MSDPGRLNHIKLEGHSSIHQYTAIQAGGGSDFPTVVRNRNYHGNELRTKLQKVERRFAEINQEDVPVDIIKDEVIYVEFYSDYNFKLKFDSLEDNRWGRFHLLSVNKEISVIEGQESIRYRTVVMLNPKGITAFIKKVEDFLDPDKDRNDKPQNNNLLSNISDIRVATLRSFWTETEYPFPDAVEECWWEVWIRRSTLNADQLDDEKVIQQLHAIGAQLGDDKLIFPEHIIRLVKATPAQLSESLMFLDNLAELRKPKDTAEFFTRLSPIEEGEWVNEFRDRTQSFITDNSIAICLLDSGVNNGHPLLETFVPDGNLDAVKPEWGKNDSERLGHGTQMAGIALYGDMTDLLASTENIEVYHQLESVKILHPNDATDPELYGATTEEAVACGQLINPDRQRLFCMAVTTRDEILYGKPSSWSTSVDRIAGGFIDGDRKLFFVSGGNVSIDQPDEYKSKNVLSSIQDPAQAFNAITVGSYTVKDWIDQEFHPGAVPLASAGEMSPSNSTSLTWEQGWPSKPDIVMEGGNLGIERNDLIEPDSLHLLSTNNNFNIRALSVFGDTSGATALASKLAAEICIEYPDLWPETVRGLLVHSANWTDVMLGNEPVSGLSSTRKKELLKTVGYGVPNKEKALYSAKDSLTLIAERTIQPFYCPDNTVKTKDIEIFELPWPTDVLSDLGEQNVRLKITLSYFIEPNPGNREYTNNFSYRSHELKFSMNSPLESIDEFRVRINGADREDDQRPETNSESWLIGPRARNKGSLVKDIWEGTAADLATKNLIGIYPGKGWYRTRKKLGKYNEAVRYSLIVSIETPPGEIDIYTPVANLVGISV